MYNLIKIKRGLDIPLLGEAKTLLKGNIHSKFVKICPDDFNSIVPKLAVKIGDKVKAGSPLFFDKKQTNMFFASPISGEIIDIERGEKRKIVNITIESEDKIEYKDFGKKEIKSLNSDEIKSAILSAGIWFLIKQRPYDIIANTLTEPRDIFVTGFDSSPLAPSYDFILKGQEKNLETGIEALSKLTKGNLYLSINKKSTNQKLPTLPKVIINKFEGPHPCGNVGVQINKISPINKGETIWTLNTLDVIIIGKLFNEGIVDLTRTIALTGSEVKETGYYKMPIGTSIQDIIKNNVTENIPLRYISGNPLTGTKIEKDGVLRAYDSQITVIPEGSDVHEAFGWASMSPEKYSSSSMLLKLKKLYRIDSRLQGGRRAIIVSNEYDKVFPMDIFPEQLLKSIISFNIDKMENLGIYEIAPEDFALCEFVDTSKLEIQKIVRVGLDLLKKEME